MDTAFRHRVDSQPAVGNFGIAVDAVAVIAVLDPSFGHLDARQIALALSFLCLRHGLLLHGIHARQAADRLLVEHDGGASLFGKPGHVLDFGLAFGEPASGNGKIDCHLIKLDSCIESRKFAFRRLPGGLPKGNAMLMLIIGLILFLGIHTSKIVAYGYRESFITKHGEGSWKGLYTVISFVGLILIVWGYIVARQQGPIILYDPPLWIRHITILLMLFAFIFLAASQVPAGRIKAAVKHPMLLSVKIWAFAHLLANGDLASVLLFGSFLVWAVADRISEKRRLEAGLTKPPEPGPLRNDIIAVVAGVVVFALFYWKLHQWLIGVPITA